MRHHANHPYDPSPTCLRMFFAALLPDLPIYLCFFVYLLSICSVVSRRRLQTGRVVVSTLRLRLPTAS
uniref:Uncharacterized protein n=1 Tax=Zea mays TaxID=4577 RepID=C0PMP5_MAIZE|nr:unknown [Zea mays]